MKYRDIIIGAGISGLSLAWFLKKHFGKDHALTVLEAEDRPGGWIRSHVEDGFLFEMGPRSCRSKGAGIETLKLVEDLGLCEEMISASPEAQKRFIYTNGKLYAMPGNPFSFLLSPLMKGVLPALLKELRVPPTDLEDESIAAFIGRRFSPEIATRLMDPLVSGIYAGDINKLSMRSCFPEMHLMEHEHGSVVKGMFRKKKVGHELSPFVQKQRLSPIFSFKNGMESLVSALYSNLKEHIQLASKVVSLRIDKDEVDVVLANGSVLNTDRVFLAVSAQAAARIVGICSQGSALLMGECESATVAVVNMGWNKRVLKKEQAGFGYLVPSSQREGVLGIVFDSCALSEQNRHGEQTRLTAMLGGALSPEVAGMAHGDIKNRTLAALEKHLNIRKIPETIKVTVARNAIPQYHVGHHNRLLEIVRILKDDCGGRVNLLGSSWRGVSVNDCIAEAKTVAFGNFFCFLCVLCAIEPLC